MAYCRLVNMNTHRQERFQDLQSQMRRRKKLKRKGNGNISKPEIEKEIQVPRFIADLLRAESWIVGEREKYEDDWLDWQDLENEIGKYIWELRESKMVGGY